MTSFDETHAQVATDWFEGLGLTSADLKGLVRRAVRDCGEGFIGVGLFAQLSFLLCDWDVNEATEALGDIAVLLTGVADLEFVDLTAEKPAGG